MSKVKEIIDQINSLEHVYDLNRIKDAASLKIILLEKDLKRKGMFVDNDIPSPMMTNEQYQKAKRND